MRSKQVLFLRNIVLLLLVNCVIFLLVLFATHFFFVLKHWKKDPDVFIIPDNKQYQFIIMGTSHGQSFTRYSNQPMVEKIVGAKFFNLAQPNAGPVMEKIYLEYFLQKGNTAKTAIYFIDPQVFYTAFDNEKYSVLPLYGEVNIPLELLLIKNHITWYTQMSYVKTYLSLKWFVKNPRSIGHDLGIYTPDKQAEKQRIHELYPQGLDQKNLSHYTQVLDEIVKLTQSQHMKLVFVIPTTLITDYSGMNQLRTLLEKYKKTEGIKYYDYSHAIEDPTLYSNIDHLNTNGVKLFSKKYLQPLISDLEK
jgi:hypothetical protein